MPSIEIVCIDQEEPIDCSVYSFRVDAGTSLVSDRAHSSTFQKDFDSLRGCIYHLLDDKGRTAYELLKKDWYDENGDEKGVDENIEFIDTHDQSFIDLVSLLLEESPIGEIVFTSDYQFGPETFRRFVEVTNMDFISTYKSRSLRMNSLYKVKKC